MFFTWGTAKDAAKFEDTVSKLARHVGTSPWPQSSVASKAMSTLRTPEFEESTVPTREYWADPGRTIRTYDRTAPGTGNTVVDNPPVLKDWEHSLQVKEYKAERKVLGLDTGAQRKFHLLLLVQILHTPLYEFLRRPP